MTAEMPRAATHNHRAPDTETSRRMDPREGGDPYAVTFPYRERGGYGSRLAASPLSLPGLTRQSMMPCSHGKLLSLYPYEPAAKYAVCRRHQRPSAPRSRASRGARERIYQALQ